MPTIISNAEELAAAIARMHEPEAFAQFCALNQDFLNADEAQFAQLLPPERARAVNTLYGVIKQYAPDYFKLLQPFCTALGQLSDELFEPVLHSGLRHASRAELKCENLELSINDLCLQIVLALFGQASKYFDQFKGDYDAMRKHQPSDEESRWLIRYYMAYLIISHYTDPALWDKVGAPNGKTYRQIFNGFLIMCHGKIASFVPEN